jgi:hypothetical protein
MDGQKKWNAALKKYVVSTPFGTGENSVCELLKKVMHTSVFAASRPVDQLVILYGLYVMERGLGAV